MKQESTAFMRGECQNREFFTMNRAKWAGKYELYSIGSGYSFGRDMAALITHGFVACVYADQSPTSKNIYRFSSMWQWYGTEQFKVTKDEWTTYMWNQYRKQQNGEAQKEQVERKVKHEKRIAEIRQANNVRDKSVIAPA